MAYRYLNKVVLLGDKRVGKSNIFTRLKSGQFAGNIYHPPEDSCKTTVRVDGKEVTLVLFYTDGEDRIEGVHPHIYLRGVKAVIFVYAIDDQESFDNIKYWAHTVDSFSQCVTNNIFLVGNKSDLEDSRQVSAEQGRDMAEYLEIGRDNFLEVSAKTGEGCNELLQVVARIFLSSGSNEAAFPLEKEDKKSRCEIC